MLSVLISQVCVLVFFVFKQKTAYEMRISDWSSDVCSSDLAVEHGIPEPLIDGGLAPARATGRDPHLLWKFSLVDLPVKRRATEPSAFEHGLDPEDAIGSFGRHGLILHCL